METSRASGLSMMVIAVIIAIIIYLFPALVVWLAWLLVIIMFLGGLLTFLTGQG